MLFTLCNNNKHSNLNLIDRHQFPWLTVSILFANLSTSTIPAAALVSPDVVDAAVAGHGEAVPYG